MPEKDTSQATAVRPPPFLLGAALLFWGWQTDLIVAGVLMAIVLEGSRFAKVSRSNSVRKRSMLRTT